jgi:tRNA nucleotidyltransferase (CCA-adding enzyme)
MKINLNAVFTGKALNAVRIVGETADNEDVPVYLVGGPVRDILLDFPAYDMDFLVEGDGTRFSEILNASLKGKLEIHRHFRTAVIESGDLKLDIVTARSETYKKPAAYPDVKPGSLKEDLFRRDFTINAMALSVNKKSFGEMKDYYGGYADLKAGIIRVTHDKSFIDDPTRIFRAVRFSARFDFKIEKHTEKLMKEAVSLGLLGELNRGRIKKELELFFKEQDPLKCLRIFENLI